MQPEDEVYLEWLAAAPKGVRWDKAQEMYALYQERRKRQAEDVAKRLLGETRKKAWAGLDADAEWEAAEMDIWRARGDGS